MEIYESRDPEEYARLKKIVQEIRDADMAFIRAGGKKDHSVWRGKDGGRPKIIFPKKHTVPDNL